MISFYLTRPENVILIAIMSCHIIKNIECTYQNESRNKININISAVKSIEYL